jgi:hypothetical protein
MGRGKPEVDRSRRVGAGSILEMKMDDWIGHFGSTSPEAFLG